MKIANRELKPGKDLLIMLSLSVVITLIMAAYFLLIGFPMTEARNLFNEGLRYFDRGDYQTAAEYFNKSLLVWDNDSARTYLLEVDRRLNLSGDTDSNQDL